LARLPEGARTIADGFSDAEAKRQMFDMRTLGQAGRRKAREEAFIEQ
jgi:hypothetical protein